MNKNNVFAEACCICIFQDRYYADVMWNGGLLEGHMLFKILQHARVLFAYHNILDTMPRASMHMRQQAMETRNWLNIFCVLARYQQARGHMVVVVNTPAIITGNAQQSFHYV